MTDLQRNVRKLRNLCTNNGIHTLRCLEVFVHMEDGKCLSHIARRAKVGKSVIGPWVSWLEVAGMIQKHEADDGKKFCTVTYTEHGKTVAAMLAGLFTQPPKEDSR